VIEGEVNMKAMIEKVLEDTGNTLTRAAKMDVTDLLKYATPHASPSICILKQMQITVSFS
jgi:hypothetical protein